MHHHSTQKSAAACSRFCAANFQDKEYYRQHCHYQDEAPVSGCWSCEEQKRKAEDKRRQQEAQLQQMMRR